MSWLSKLWKDEDEKERCGAGFLRTPKSDRLTPACAVHDVEYVRAEKGRQPKSRSQVDKEFLERMLEAVRFEPIGWRRTLLRTQAYTYYLIVRTIGGFFWDGEL